MITSQLDYASFFLAVYAAGYDCHVKYLDGLITHWLIGLSNYLQIISQRPSLDDYRTIKISIGYH